MLALRGMRVHDILALAAPVLLLWVAGPGPAAAHSSAQVASTPPAPVAAAAAASGLPPEAVLAAVRQATATYLDIEKARADGYVQISGMETNHGVHFLNVNAQMLSAAAGLFSAGRVLASPPMLIYVPTRDGRWQLAAAEYALPSSRLDTNPFPGAAWSEHEASCHYRDYRELPAPAPASCPKVHPVSGAPFVLFHPKLAIVHVWAWYPNPRGVYADQNPYLAPYGGVGTPEHHHGAIRSGPEIAYSEFNHRSSGVFLLVIAAVAFWQARGPRRRAWSAASAALWIAFGVYLFVRSDPEAWPWGPLGLRESLGDTEVLQHKLLTLIPIAIGLAEALYGGGGVRRRPSLWLVSALALVGGVGLFLHFHEGRLHLDWIYAQHAAMGLAGLAAGAALLLSRRAGPGSRLHLLWPTVLVLMSVVLLFYTE